MNSKDILHLKFKKDKIFNELLINNPYKHYNVNVYIQGKKLYIDVRYILKNDIKRKV